MNFCKESHSLPDWLVALGLHLKPSLHILFNFLHRVIPFHEVRCISAFRIYGAEESVVFGDIDVLLIVGIDELLRLYIRIEYLPDFETSVQILCTARRVNQLASYRM